MKTRKLLLKCLSGALSLFMFAGCSMVTVDEDMDNAQVVATVNGTQILKGDIMEEFDIYSTYYGYDPEQPNTGTNKETGDAYKDLIWQEHVDSELLQQKAQELGISLSQERTDELAQILVDNKEYYLEAAEYQAKELLGVSEGEEYEAEVARQYDMFLESNGFLNGVFEAYQLRYAWVDEMTDYLAQSIEPTEEELQAWYDENLAAQKEELESFPGGLLTHNSEGSILHVPDGNGYKYIRHILIELPQDIQTEIYSLRSSGDEEGADALRDEELAKIKSEIDAAYERILGGESFADVCAELTDDDFMDNEENLEYGRIFFDDIGGEEEEFVEAVKDLENVGDYTEPFASDDGYHIVQYSQELPAGDISFEDAKDIARENVISSLASAKYLEELEIWRTEASIEDFKSRLY